MQNGTNQEVALPTGIWLAQERQRLGMTRTDVARVVQGHHRTVQAVEQHNRIIPPGWYPALRKRGMHICEPVWPAWMRPYSGADLRREMQTRAGFQNSRIWLCRQLCVPESAVSVVLRDNLLVPPSWLLKLAELGAMVPVQVHITLCQAARGSQAQAATALNVDSAQPDGDFGNRPSATDSRGSAATEPTVSAAKLDTSSRQSAAEADAGQPAPHEGPSLYFHWSEAGGLQFQISSSLLEQIPGGVKDLLIRLHQLGLLDPARSRQTSTQGA